MAKPAKSSRIPAYRQIQRELVQEISARNPQPNAQYYSEKEIIERFGVSRVTVRQAFELLEKEGYIYRVQGKGTFIGSLATKPVKTVAFVAPCLMMNGVEMILPHAMEETLNLQGCNLAVCNHNNDLLKAERTLRWLVKCRIDAIIYSCVSAGDDYAQNARLIEYVLADNIPLVQVDRVIEVPGREICSVTAEVQYGACSMAPPLAPEMPAALAQPDDPYARPALPATLTMMRAPLREMGRLAALMALDLIQGKAIAPRQVRVPCEVVVRDAGGTRLVLSD